MMQDEKGVMIDLETLDNSPTSCIIAIGAVEFDPVANELGREFYRVVDAKSSTELGLTISADTVMWWMKQDAKVRNAFNEPGIDIFDALEQFHTWYPNGLKPWGNGAGFDNVILETAYKLINVEPPWKFYDNRCYRTIAATRPDLKRVNIGVHHNALDDAKSQAIHLMKILRGEGLEAIPHGAGAGAGKSEEGHAV